MDTYFATSEIKTEDGENPIYGKFWVKWIGERFEDFLLTVSFQTFLYL